MEHNRSNEPNDSEHEASPSADEALRRLEDRLDRASQAAERLLAQAAGQSATPRRPPPAGWQVPDPDAGSAGERETDLELFTSILASLRELIPPELQRRLAEALRELLLALRALIDWYLERLERRHAEPVEIQDIPIL